MDIEEEKKPTGKLCTPTKLPGCENDENLAVASSTVNSEVYFDLRQLSIAKLVEDSTLKFLCKLKTYEMIFNILQSLLLLNSKWCNYCNTLL